MTAPTTYANPYWDLLADRVHHNERHPWDPGPFVGGDGHWADYRRRQDLVSDYAWTISDPAAVAFVAEHSGARVIDPLAGTGYWAWLLQQHGADVAASDLNPADGPGSAWHRGGRVFTPVYRADAVDAVTTLGHDRTLLLSWPPYDDPIGARILAAYTGPRVVYIGETSGGCCGDDTMWSALESGWHEAAEHKPVQWWGLHDWITVYDRSGAS